MHGRIWIAPGLVSGDDGSQAELAARAESAGPLRVLTHSRTTQTALVDLPPIGRVVRKTWTFPRATDRARGVFRTTWGARSPARREAEALGRLLSLPGGPFAPRPLLYLERRGSGVLRSCVLVMEEVREAVDLATWLGATPEGTERRQVLADLAGRTAEMHRAGLVDRDFHPRNVLVHGARRRTFKIDGPKQRVLDGAAPDRLVALDLGALDVGLVRLATSRERVRFLYDYDGGHRGNGGRRDLCARVIRVRNRIDERESRRLGSPGGPARNPHGAGGRM